MTLRECESEEDALRCVDDAIPTLAEESTDAEVEAAFEDVDRETLAPVVPLEVKECVGMLVGGAVEPAVVAAIPEPF